MKFDNSNRNLEMRKKIKIKEIKRRFLINKIIEKKKNIVILNIIVIKNNNEIIFMGNVSRYSLIMIFFF